MVARIDISRVECTYEWTANPRQYLHSLGISTPVENPQEKEKVSGSPQARLEKKPIMMWSETL